MLEATDIRRADKYRRRTRITNLFGLTRPVNATPLRSGINTDDKPLVCKTPSATVFNEKK